MNRRNFIKSTGRGLALSGLTIMGLIIGTRDDKQSPSKICQLNLPCQKCRKKESCTDISKRNAELSENSGNRDAK